MDLIALMPTRQIWISQIQARWSVKELYTLLSCTDEEYNYSESTWHREIEQYPFFYQREWICYLGHAPITASLDLELTSRKFSLGNVKDICIKW